LRLTLRSYVIDKYVTSQKLPIPVHIDKLFELPTTLCTLELDASTTAGDVSLKENVPLPAFATRPCLAL
jgi:hypothetical protein